MKTGKRSHRFETLERRVLLAANPIISEFMASNQDTLLDGQTPAQSSDWIEIFNSGDEPIDLQGWYLTDNAANLMKWKFPSVIVLPNAFLVVFASGLGIPDRKGNLHTNFKLSSTGEFLALVQPDGRITVSQFGSADEDYPRQVSDVSYGIAMQPMAENVIAAGAAARVLIPSSNDPGDWTGGDTSFNDDPSASAWFDASNGIGFGNDDSLIGIIQSNIEKEMSNVNASALIRIPFQVEDANAIDALALQVAYDDGFAAYLNGKKIAESNAPEELNFDSTATAEHNAVGSRLNVVPGNTSILYDFEEDGGQVVSDKLPQDGRQVAIFNSGGSVDSNPGRAAFGSRSLRIPGTVGPPSVFNRIRLPGTANLGNQFTLAVQADMASTRFQRLFTNYNGTGVVASERLIFDVDPTGIEVPGVRVVVGERGVLQTDAVPVGLREPGYHHFALVYDEGEVQVFLDGEVVLAGNLGSGPLRMPLDLFFGEDPHDGGGTSIEQFSGSIDDLLVLSGQAVSHEDIALLANEGAEALFTSGGRDPLLETFDVSPHANDLNSGHNLLAIQGLNITTNDDDFFLLPVLFAIENPDMRTPKFFAEPSPGEVNRLPIDGIVTDTTFSVDRGFYSQPFSVQISVDTPGSVIVYTTDGSHPTLENGIQSAASDPFSQPRATVEITTTTTLRAAAFKTGFQASNVDTHTYVFLNDVIRQPNRPDGYPTRWGPTRADYEMDPEIVNVSPYRETIVDDLKSIPTISLTLDRADFFGPRGIYSNTTSRGPEWERPVSVEYFDVHHDEEFQINAGLRVHGGFSRDPSASPQHSLRLHFRSDYGPGKLDFPLFDDSAITRFDALVLNAQSSDNWSSINTITGRVAQFMRDQWAQDMQREMGHVHIPGKYAHLYINGLYWGMYNVMERLDDDFAAEHYGGGKEEYDIVVDEVAFRGDLSAWRDLLSRARARDYESTLELLDIDNFIDYMIVNMYMGNWDWPDHNWHAVRRRVDGEKFQFVVWDAEVGMGLDVNVPGPIRPGVLDVDIVGRRRDVGAAELANGPGEIYNRLRSLPEFQLRFGDRIHHHFFNDGALTPENAAAVYEARANEIQAALVGQSARWGDVRRRTPDVPDGVWASERDWIVNTFFQQRGEIVVQDFRDERLYPRIEAPEFSQHGGRIVREFQLTISHPHPKGEILFTLDGTDPRLAGGEISPSAVSYQDPISLELDSVIQARVVVDGEWSALNSAAFVVGELHGDFDRNGMIDEADINLLCRALRDADPSFDLNQDNTINQSDVNALIEGILGTTLGDANLDGVFESADLVEVFRSGKYEKAEDETVVWSEGDWNCDGRFDSSDLVLALEAGRYQF